MTSVEANEAIYLKQAFTSITKHYQKKKPHKYNLLRDAPHFIINFPQIQNNQINVRKCIFPYQN